MTVVAVVLFVFAALWLASAQKRARGRGELRAPDNLPDAVPRERPSPLTAPLPSTAPPAHATAEPKRDRDRAVALTSAGPVRRATDTRATAWMLRERGLCSPDPHR